MSFLLNAICFWVDVWESLDLPDLGLHRLAEPLIGPTRSMPQRGGNGALSNHSWFPFYISFCQVLLTLVSQRENLD